MVFQTVSEFILKNENYQFILILIFSRISGDISLLGEWGLAAIKICNIHWIVLLLTLARLQVSSILRFLQLNPSNKIGFILRHAILIKLFCPISTGLFQARATSTMQGSGFELTNCFQTLFETMGRAVPALSWGLTDWSLMRMFGYSGFQINLMRPWQLDNFWWFYLAKLLPLFLFAICASQDRRQGMPILSKSWRKCS